MHGATRSAQLAARSSEARPEPRAAQSERRAGRLHTPAAVAEALTPCARCGDQVPKFELSWAADREICVRCEVSETPPVSQFRRVAPLVWPPLLGLASWAPGLIALAAAGQNWPVKAMGGLVITGSFGAILGGLAVAEGLRLYRDARLSFTSREARLATGQRVSGAATVLLSVPALIGVGCRARRTCSPQAPTAPRTRDHPRAAI